MEELGPGGIIVNNEGEERPLDWFPLRDASLFGTRDYSISPGWYDMVLEVVEAIRRCLATEGIDRFVVVAYHKPSNSILIALKSPTVYI